MKVTLTIQNYRCFVRPTTIELTNDFTAFVGVNSYSALAEYQKLETMQPHWKKAQNWRLALEMTEGELRATDLGAFLDAL